MSHANLKSVIDEFNREFPRPKLGPISICELVDLEPGYLKKLPDASNAGVYVVFSADNCVLYIGKASFGNRIADRLSFHFDMNGQASGEKDWHLKSKRVAIIPMPSGHAFESPALEEFLIWKCKPPGNKNGYKKGHKSQAALLDAVRDQTPG